MPISRELPHLQLLFSSVLPAPVNIRDDSRQTETADFGLLKWSGAARTRVIDAARCR